MSSQSRQLYSFSPSNECTLRSDHVAMEAPLQFVGEDGQKLFVVLRTPGHDVELARGLLFSEGVRLAGLTFTAGATRAGVDELMVGGLRPDAFAARVLSPTTACGTCGTLRLPGSSSEFEPDADVRLAASVIRALPDAMRAAQGLFSQTGGSHAAALFDGEGLLQCIREDIGRHNAVDKVVGWAHEHGRLPLATHALCVSGRASYEIVLKAARAGIQIVAAVSAPSTAAIDAAEQARITLCGFTRAGSFNVYSHVHRIR